MVRLLSLLRYLFLVSLCTNAAVVAQCVSFDIAPIVAAQDVSTDDFLRSNPDEKLVRIRIPVSSLVSLRSEKSLVQYLVIISSLDGPSDFQIVDFSPKTELASDVEGTVKVERTEGSTGSLGVNAFALRELPVKGEATAAVSKKLTNATRVEQLPRLELVSASGTMDRGRSVYFKIKPSSQSTLEGDKVYEIVARVPYGWRADTLQVRCSAFSHPPRAKQQVSNVSVCVTDRFVVGVYVSGDEAAKQSVRRLATTQSHLKTLAFRHADAIEDETYPTWGHRLGAAFSLVKPRIPAHWLDQLITSHDYHSFERHLPRQVRSAATEYREARKHVDQFAG